MIGLFVLGSFATVAGILLAWFVIHPETSLGENASTLAGMLTGTYTGGSVNFNAIALEYEFQEQGVLYAGTIAVDNVVTTFWIIVTLALPRLLNPIWKDNRGATQRTETTEKLEKKGMDMFSLAWLLVLGTFCFFIAETLSSFFPDIPSILTLTTLGILLAQTKFVTRLNGAHTLGLYMVFLFLAVIGAYCEIEAVVALKEI